MAVSEAASTGKVARLPTTMVFTWRIKRKKVILLQIAGETPVMRGRRFALVSPRCAGFAVFLAITFPQAHAWGQKRFAPLRGLLEMASQSSVGGSRRKCGQEIVDTGA